MTVGIDDGKFLLKDNWPDANPMTTYPADLTVKYAAGEELPCPIGTKVRIYQPTNHDLAAFMLLEYKKGTAVAAGTKSICCPHTTACAAAGAQYIVTNDGGESNHACGMVAVALCTLADGDRAWFWVGGVCPVDTVPGLDGIIASDGSVAQGSVLTTVDSASVCKLGVLAMNDAAAMFIPCGSAFEADTTS